MSEDELFEKFVKVDCGCVSHFGYCLCTPLERACRYVSMQTQGEWFTEEQRQCLRGQILWQSEGSINEEEIEGINDRMLAKAWLYTANDYVQSQI